MLRLFVGGLLVVHGLIHAAIWLPQAFGGRAAADPASPFDPGHSWLFSRLGEGGARWLSIALALIAAGGFMAAGVGLVAQAEVWRPLTAAAAVISLALFVLYFSPWLSLAVLLDLALLWALLWTHWPSIEQMGA